MFNRMYNRVAERAAAKVYAKLTEGQEKKEKKKSTIKQLISNPDDFVLQMWTEGDEVRIKFTKKEAFKSYGDKSEI